MCSIASTSSINAGSGTRVIGATFLGGFWENIGIFGSFNGVPGQTAAATAFITTAGGQPRGGRTLQLSPDATQIVGNLGEFRINTNNTANGCIIGGGLCSPVGRVVLLLEVEDGSLLAFRFFDEEEEEDDEFSNRGDEEDWQ